MIDGLREKAKSQEGVWVYARQEFYEALFPNASEDEIYVPLKIFMTPDAVRVYSIWDDGLPCLKWYDAQDAYFEDTEDGVRFITSGRPLIEVARQDDIIDRGAFKNWFLNHLEISKEEYEEIVVKNGQKDLLRISTIGGVREEDEEEVY
jgi:hypothetical protein